MGVSPPASGGVDPCHHLGDLGPLELCTSRFLSFGATKFEVTGHGNNGKPAPEINQFSGQQKTGSISQFCRNGPPAESAGPWTPEGSHRHREWQVGSSRDPRRATSHFKRGPRH